uniref:GDNF family receptor alpha 1 n=1 Tax=Oreochromis niloticus TaxID=8128 RepID=A0A669CVR1_ORENI
MDFNTRKTMILAVFYVLLPVLDVLSYAEENLRARLDCVRANEQCLKEQACSTKYRTMRQCVAGGKESNFSMVAGLEAKDECRSAIDALKQSPLYNCRCKRGMKKEKNCLRIYWGMYQSLQGNDFLEDSPYEPVNSRLSDIFRLAPIIGNAIQAFGNGTDVGVWQPMSPVQTTTSITTPYQRNRERNPNTIDNHINTDPAIYHFCGSLQAQKLQSNSSADAVLCVDPQIDGPSTSNAILRNSAASTRPEGLASLLPPLLWLWYCSLPVLSWQGNL